MLISQPQVGTWLNGRATNMLRQSKARRQIRNDGQSLREQLREDRHGGKHCRELHRCRGAARMGRAECEALYRGAVGVGTRKRNWRDTDLYNEDTLPPRALEVIRSQRLEWILLGCMIASREARSEAESVVEVDHLVSPTAKRLFEGLVDGDVAEVDNVMIRLGIKRGEGQKLVACILQEIRQRNVRRNLLVKLMQATDNDGTNFEEKAKSLLEELAQ